VTRLRGLGARRARCAAALVVVALVACAPADPTPPPLRAHAVLAAGADAGSFHPWLLGYNSLWFFRGMGILGDGGYDAELLQVIDELGVRLLRYPGGTVSHTFHWHEAVGPPEGREPQLVPFLADERFRSFGRQRLLPAYGPDEFLEVCARVGAEPLLVCAFAEGTPGEAAAWVAYLNGDPADTRSIVDAPEDGGRHWETVGHWAALRVAHGRSEPYGVRLFEIGNEVDLERYGRTVSGYAGAFLRYARAMKRVDPSIRIGAVGHDRMGEPGHRDREAGGPPWNETLFERVGTEADFLCLHYYARRDGRAGTTLDVLAEPVVHGRRIRRIRDELERRFGARAPFLAVTEHAVDSRAGGGDGTANATLRAALAVADTIFELARSGVRIGCLHVLNLRFDGESPFLGFATVLDHRGRRILAPHYHVVRLLSRHAGEALLEVETKSPTLRPGFDEALAVDAVSGIATKDANGRPTVYAVNKHPRRSVALEVVLEVAHARARATVVTGDGPDASNRDGPRVVPAPLAVEVGEGTVRVVLPPLSFAMLEIGR